MIIDCIADLHGFYPQMQGGDLLIVAGDLTANDRTHQYLEFREWIRSQNYKKKIVVFGNHDMAIYDGRLFFNSEWFGADFLTDQGIEYEYLDIGDDGVAIVKKKLKIWGSPRTLTFRGINPHCTAYTGTETEIGKKFCFIPDDTDILITHGPPYGILDIPQRFSLQEDRECHVGSMMLRRVVQDKIYFEKEFYHIFGHIHECYGKIAMGGANFINCSHVNVYYEPVNPPVRIVL